MNYEHTKNVLSTLIEQLKVNKKIKLKTLYSSLTSLSKSDIDNCCYFLLEQKMIEVSRHCKNHQHIVSVTRVTPKGFDYYNKLNKSHFEKALDFCKEHLITGIGKTLEELPSHLFHHLP